MRLLPTTNPYFKGVGSRFDHHHKPLALRCCVPYRAPYNRARRRVARLQRRIVALPAPCRACLAIQHSGQAACCIATHKAAPQPQYNFVSRLPPARSRARKRCRTPLCAGWPYHGLPWPCRGLSRPYRGRVPAPAARCATLCYNTKIIS